MKDELIYKDEKEKKAIHFNWGFHNAKSDLEHGRPNKWAQKAHFDQAYKTGYLYGYSDEFAKSTEALSQALAWGDIE